MSPRPDKHSWALIIAQDIALRSTCMRLAVGAIAVLDGQILATGYNGAPAGIPHCDHTEDDNPCTESVHAEANVIASAARHGVSLRGSVFYTTHMPCRNCAGLMINAGIAECCYADPYRDDGGTRLLGRAGVRVWRKSI